MSILSCLALSLQLACGGGGGGGSTTPPPTPPPSNLVYASNPAVYTKGVAIPDNTATVMNGPAFFLVSPPLPAGLSIAQFSGQIYGKPTAITPTALYTVTATNTHGKTTAGVSITVNDVTPSSLSYSSNPAIYTVGSPIAANLPSSSGGAVISYSVTPALPAGMTLDPKTGVILGAPPTADLATTVYTITATNSGGSTTVGLSITINSLPPATLAYAYSSATFHPGTAMAADSPSTTGGVVASYSASPALPAGIGIDTTTGVISGTPSGITADTTYTVTATNAFGSASTALQFKVVPDLQVTGPAGQATNVGNTATFSVGLVATGGVTYQWQQNDLDIPGATASTYTTPPTALSDSGTRFRVVVSDTYGSQVTSAEGTLTVYLGFFTAAGHMHIARTGHTATLLLNGLVLVAGGDDNASTATGELYDPASGTFAAAFPLGEWRGQHHAVLLPDGRVLLAGGVTSAGAPLGSAVLYDPSAGTYGSTGSLGTARRDDAAVLLGNGKVLITGGRDAGGTPLASAELYDPVTGTFSPAGSMTTGRFLHPSILLPSGKVLIAGGRTFGGLALASAELYDPATGSFTSTGALGAARWSPSGSMLNTGKALVAGGRYQSTGPTIDLLTAELYDPAAGTFSATGASTSILGIPCLLSDGEVLFPGTIQNASERFDPALGTFSITGPMTEYLQYGFAATLLPNGKVLVTGGTNLDQVVNDVEIYDPQ